MFSIGLRASPKKVSFAIIERAEGVADAALVVRNVDEIVIPLALRTAEQLRFVRTNVIDVIEEYGATRAGIRLTEGNARGVSTFRLNLEGVLQEALSSSPVERYFCGTIATIASLLGERDRRVIKRYIENEETFRALDSWAKHGEAARECILVGTAALALTR